VIDIVTCHPSSGITLANKPSVMEDPHVVLKAPELREQVTPYQVELPSGSTARMIPIRHKSEVSSSLIAYVMKEFNDEVYSFRRDQMKLKLIAKID